MCSNFAFDSSLILQISEIGHLNKNWSFWKNYEKGKKPGKAEDLKKFGYIVLRGYIAATEEVRLNV